MESRHSLAMRFALIVFATVVMAAAVGAQEASPSSADPSLVTDWTHHHVVYSSPDLASLPPRLRQEPRYWQQWLRRNPKMILGGDASPANAATRPGRHRFKRDWSMSLGPGATVGAGHYPAKYSFSINTANCGNATHPDFVAFNTSVAGSATQATIVAFDNLYASCTVGTVPSTYWAYNTGGTVQTSSVLSLDGTQLAFVQSVASHAQLVLLKWQASTTATSTSPGPITSVSTSQYSSCTAPCMTTIAFSGGANDTNSSAFIDYSGDAIYVGDDAGVLHKFTPIFRGGTPAEITAGWPVTVAAGLQLSSPVYDHPSGKVFVGSGFSGTGSQLFSVIGSTGVIAGTSSSLGKGVGISASPIVDSSTGEVFVFLGNDGSTGCGGSPCMIVHQFPTSFTSGTGNQAIAGTGGAFPLYDGDFDNTYFTSGNGTGNLIVCGGSFFGLVETTIYRMPINAGLMNAGSSTGPPLATSGVPCSPVTDIFNPAGGGVDRFFASVTSGSDVQSCASGGCITNLVSNPWKASTSYSVGEVVLDPGNYMQVANNSGTSKSGTAPPWVDNCGNTTSDNTIIWTNAGLLTPRTPQAWQSGTFWSVGFRILDSNLNIECALETGIASGATAPVWKTAVGAVTTESTGLQWRNGGPMTTHALSTAGGTSGIIMDNILGTAGSSQVYFSTLGTGGCGAGNGCAIQASQAGLN